MSAPRDIVTIRGAAQRAQGPVPARARRRSAQSGMTLLELIVACGILLVLATVAIPLQRVIRISHKEGELRADLLEMRTAIDRYKDDADKNLIQVQAGTEGYPPDLQTLVNGVQLAGAQDQKVRYLRKIPIDPFTGDANWGLRSVQDDADSAQWGGQDVFDVYSRAQGTALDGTKYSDW
ncbi:MAG: type II secretion system protein [Acidobacteriota bacterium]|nr:type II secretion system protein [Acidobacteriota bacterium]MDE3171270.1 type II secretion system protein [Acidobacteriota bacterium]